MKCSNTGSAEAVSSLARIKQRLVLSTTMMSKALRLPAPFGSVPNRLIYIISACKKGYTMASNIVYCPRCNSDHVYRHGKSAAGHVRYRCPACPHVFQLTYTYEACKPGVKEKIVEMAFNSAGVRDTARVLKISKNTVTSVLKNSAQSKLPLKR